MSEKDPLVLEYQNGFARALLNAGGVYQTQNKLDKALENRRQAADIRARLCSANPSAMHLRSGWGVALNGVGATLRDLDRIDESIQVHEKAHEQHVAAVNGDPAQTIPRLRLIDGLISIARSQTAGNLFPESVRSIDSIEEFLLPGFSQPCFSMGREYMVIACKVGDLPAEQASDEWVVVRAQCIEKAQASLGKAAERGFDVLKWSKNDTVFKNFSKYPEGSEMLAWIERRFTK